MSKTTVKNPSAKQRFCFGWLRLICSGLILADLAACASPTFPTVAGPEEIFPKPEQAVSAYVDAIRNSNQSELLKILGPDASDLISSGDPVADKKWRSKFITAYETAHRLESDGDNKEILIIGTEEWPMPIPLIHVEEGWQFDTASGKDEILNRRIGHNELNAIGICRAYVEAQREYAAQHHLADGTPQYAQKFISSKGKHDGLYWPVRAGKPESPLGPLVAYARAQGYVNAGTHKKQHMPYHGYFYKILKQQGPNAAGGAKNYIINGHMTNGFALVAFPARYGDSGVMTFIINQNGIVYEKNLGPDTTTIAAHLTQYDPDKSWSIFQEDSHLSGK